MPCGKYKSQPQRRLCYATKGWKDWSNIRKMKGGNRKMKVRVKGYLRKVPGRKMKVRVKGHLMRIPYKKKR